MAIWGYVPPPLLRNLDAPLNSPPVSPSRSTEILPNSLGGSEVLSAGFPQARGLKGMLEATNPVVPQSVFMSESPTKLYSHVNSQVSPQEILIQKVWGNPYF